MTYSGLAQTGRGVMVLFLRIAGIPYVFSTSPATPHASDSWYHDEGFLGVMPWLKYEGVTLEERASFLDGTLELGTIDVKLVDAAGGVTELVSSWRARNMTRLVSELLSVTTASMAVDSTANFPSSDVVWLGQEAIGYAWKTATSFVTLTRGLYGTRAVKHEVDLEADIPVAPAVLDGPQILAGRRANIYAATSENGTVSESECIYRGVIGPDIDVGRAVWSLRLDHITNLWSRKVCTDLPKAAIRPGYYFSGDIESVSAVQIVQTHSAAGGHTTATVTVPRSFYSSPDDLKTNWNDAAHTAFAAAGLSRYVYLAYSDDGEKILLTFEEDATYELEVRVRYGDPLWALGFDPGNYHASTGASIVLMEADDEPRLFSMEVGRPWVSLDNPYVFVDDAHRFEAGLAAVMGEHPYITIDSIAAPSSLGTQVTFGFGMDRARDDGQDVLVIEEEEQLELKHVFRFQEGSTLTQTIKALMGINLLDSHPANWSVRGLEDDDFDWDELEEALIGAPTELQRFYDAIAEPIVASEVICDRLGLLGIAPRITSQGRIGFARLVQPHESVATSVELNDSMWEQLHARDIITQVEGEPLLNQLGIQHSHHYGTGKWGPEEKITVEDGIAQLGKVRSRVYRCRGLIVTHKPGVTAFHTARELVHAVATRAVGSHFGVFGRVAPVVDIPCTWTARQLLIGDVVELTHPCLVDVANGTVGVTGRLGVVVGRRLAVTDQEIDSIMVQLPPTMRGAQIAPCALATSWDKATLTLTFADTSIFARSGETDLTYLTVGKSVEFTEWDSETPATFSAAVITGATATTLTLSADPFGGSFPLSGVMVHWRDYSYAGVDQSWLFMGDTSYTLGSAPDEAYQWGL